MATGTTAGSRANALPGPNQSSANAQGPSLGPLHSSPPTPALHHRSSLSSIQANNLHINPQPNNNPPPPWLPSSAAPQNGHQPHHHHHQQNSPIAQSSARPTASDSGPYQPAGFPAPSGTSAFQYYPNLASGGVQPLGQPNQPNMNSGSSVSDPFGGANKHAGQKRNRDDGADDHGDDFAHSGDWMSNPNDVNNGRMHHNGDIAHRALNPPPAPPTTQGGVVGATGKITKTHTDPLISQALNPDGTPKRPMNAFMIFARKRRPEVAAENPALRTGEISKLLSKEWKSIDADAKQFYLTKAKSLKDNFTALFPQYVYRRRPNHSRKKRKTEQEPAGYGPGSPDDAEDDVSPGPAGQGGYGPSSYGGGQHPHMQQHHAPGGYHHAQPYPNGPPHQPPYGQPARPSSGASHRYFDGPASGPQGSQWDRAKAEPDSPRLAARGSAGYPVQPGSSNVRATGPNTSSARGHSTSNSGGGSYQYNGIPSPNFGPVGRPPAGGGGSNPPSANHTPSLTPSLPPVLMPGAPPNGTWMGSNGGPPGPPGPPPSGGGNSYGATGSHSQQPQPHSNGNPYGEWGPRSTSTTTPTPEQQGFGNGGSSSYRGGGGSVSTVQGVLSGSGAPGNHTGPSRGGAGWS